MCYMLNILHHSIQTRIGEIKQENVTTFSAQLNHIMTGETINKAPIKSDTSTFSDTNRTPNIFAALVSAVVDTVSPLTQSMESTPT